MRHVKSERLKKLETELNDLEQWLKMGLVPKKDISKHKEEIAAIRGKIEDEKERLQFLKESGEGEEFTAPKRAPTRGAYTEMPSIPDIDIAETGGVAETGFDMETDAMDVESSIIEERDDHDDMTLAEEDEDDSKETKDEEEEDDNFFSDRNRWRRGGIIDPDADEW
jgi:hypothetical protein